MFTIFLFRQMVPWLRDDKCGVVGRQTDDLEHLSTFQYTTARRLCAFLEVTWHLKNMNDSSNAAVYFYYLGKRSRVV